MIMLAGSNSLGTTSAIINLSLVEHGIDDRNPFSRVYMPDEQPEEHSPIPLDCIRQIQHDCAAVDHEKRWLLALISDTGMRLSEAVGLLKEDIIFDNPTPRVIIQPHP